MAIGGTGSQAGHNLQSTQKPHQNHPGLQAGVDASEMPEQRLHLLVRGGRLVGHPAGAQGTGQGSGGPRTPGAAARDPRGAPAAPTQGLAHGRRVGTGRAPGHSEGGHRRRVGTRVLWGGVRGCAQRGLEGSPKVDVKEGTRVGYY